jgi:hypothetical protein
MTFKEFEAEALRVWAEIPEEYKEGIDGIVIRKEQLLQGGYEDYYTLGTCSTEPYPSDYRGPDTSRSILYPKLGLMEVGREHRMMSYGAKRIEKRSSDDVAMVYHLFHSTVVVMMVEWTCVAQEA